LDKLITGINTSVTHEIGGAELLKQKQQKILLNPGLKILKKNF
jgi:hypothetical protein